MPRLKKCAKTGKKRSNNVNLIGLYTAPRKRGFYLQLPVSLPLITVVKQQNNYNEKN